MIREELQRDKLRIREREKGMGFRREVSRGERK